MDKPQTRRSTLLILGGALLVLGVVLLVSPVAAGNVVVRIVALVLTAAGVVAFVQAFRSAESMQRTVSMVLGAIVAALGLLVWFNPEVGSGFLTALLMGFFLVNGVWKLMMAPRFRPLPAWRWLLLSGIVSLLFVGLLWWQWPVAAAWVIGVLVGLDLCGAGATMILLALGMGRPGSGSAV
jgi:uncharacterized membrane protein HdeD (DUF308 family)